MKRLIAAIILIAAIATEAVAEPFVMPETRLEANIDRTKITVTVSTTVTEEMTAIAKSSKRDDWTDIVVISKNVKIANDMYIFERCHIIAKCLGGDEIANNGFVGTHRQNQEMWNFEKQMLYEIVPKHKTVLYEVSVIYNDIFDYLPTVIMMFAKLPETGEVIAESVITSIEINGYIYEYYDERKSWYKINQKTGWVSEAQLIY